MELELTKFDEINSAIDIARDINSLLKIDIELDRWKKYAKQNKESNIVLNRINKYRIKLHCRIGEEYERLESERGDKLHETKDSSRQLTNPTTKQQAQEQIGKSRQTINKWVKAKSIEGELDDYEKECNEKQIEMSEGGFIETIIKKQEREKRDLNFKSAPLPNKKYDVILADPPWRYEHSISKSREIENQYPTMSLDEICNMDIESIAYKDCVLFLWATSPKLEESLQVINSWGFKYRTCMVWVKDKFGMGYYARQQHELLLIAIRGNPETPMPSNRPSSVINAPRTEHSKKPEIIYSIIEKMYPNKRYIEIFAREKRKGWASHGNEIE